MGKQHLNVAWSEREAMFDLSDATKESPVSSVRFGITPQSPCQVGSERRQPIAKKTPPHQLLNDCSSNTAQMSPPCRKLLSLIAYGSLSNDLSETGVCAFSLPNLFLSPASCGLEILVTV
jgi:hypothetical protein